MRRSFVAGAVVVGLVVGVGAYVLGGALRPARTGPTFEPPVLAGQQLWGYCAGGFYARLGDTIVLTSTGHCTSPGTIAYDPDGVTVRGVFGPAARDETCPYPGHTCAASDMNYLVVAADRIPWGHLNVVDMGTGGYRVIAPGTTAPSLCRHRDRRPGRDRRTRHATAAGRSRRRVITSTREDGDYFPCMVAARIPVETGDSGGAVLVRGIPAGVTRAASAGTLASRPSPRGWTQLGLELCTTPDCGLTRGRPHPSHRPRRDRPH